MTKSGNAGRGRYRRLSVSVGVEATKRAPSSRRVVPPVAPRIVTLCPEPVSNENETETDSRLVLGDSMLPEYWTNPVIPRDFLKQDAVTNLLAILEVAVGRE